MTTRWARIFIVLLFSSSSSGDYGSCGGCHCITDPVGGECPVPVPATNFSSVFSTARALAYSNPISLDCDPYNDDECNTEPPLEDGEVCAISLSSDTPHSCPAATTYTLETTSEQDAMDRNLVITHYSACGVCSSLQDLAIYMEFPDLTAQGTVCATIGLADFDLGVKCWTDFGMSLDCANIQMHNAINTAANCGLVCMAKAVEGRPNNGVAPSCTLDECLQCDEDESGHIFKKFGGRNRRNSGLLSAIVRDCDALVDLDQTKDLCEAAELTTLAPSMPTSMPGSTFSLSFTVIAYCIGCLIMLQSVRNCHNVT